MNLNKTSKENYNTEIERRVEYQWKKEETDKKTKNENGIKKNEKEKENTNNKKTREESKALFLFLINNENICIPYCVICKLSYRPIWGIRTPYCR